MVRFQPPAYSPMAFGDLFRGLGVVLGGRRREAIARLEAILSRRFGGGEIALCGSGTQALDLALRIGRRALGDPSVSAALPAYSCYDLATAAVGARIPVHFYDVDPTTLSPDLDSLSRAVQQGGRVVVAAPLFGYPVAWDSVREVASSGDVVLVEDAAQAGGARWSGRPVGSFGELSVVSFGRGKGWMGGGGGALMVRGHLKEAFAKEDLTRTGRGPAGMPAATASLFQWLFGRPGLYGGPARIPWLGLGETHYREPRSLGPIPTFSAGLAGATAEASERERSTRQRVAGALTQGLESLSAPADLVLPVRPVVGAEPGYLRFPVLLARRDALPERARALGVSRGYPRALPDLPQVADLRASTSNEYAGARRLAGQLVTLPTHRFVSASDVSRLVELVADTIPA